MYVYPHDDLPLLPRLLLPVFGELKIPQLGDVCAERLTDLSFCAMLPPAQRQAVANEVRTKVQTLFYVGKPPACPGRLRVPAHVRLSDLRLTDRALVSLQRHAIFANDGIWRTAALTDLIGTKPGHRRGARLLLAILLAAEHAGGGFDDAETLKPLPLLHDPTPVSRTLEGQLRALALTRIHSQRICALYLDAQGWGGRGAIPVRELAKEFGVSYERARQLCRAGADAMSAAESETWHAHLPALIRAVDVLEEAAPCLVADAEGRLLDSGACSGPDCVHTALSAAQRFQVSTTLHQRELDGQAFVCQQAHLDGIAAARRAARKMLRASGLVKVVELQAACLYAIERTSGRYDARTRARIAHLALESMPGWVPLGARGEWAAIAGPGAGEQSCVRGPASRIVKLASYFSGIRLRDAKSALERHLHRWPDEVLLSLCLRAGLRVLPLADDWWIELEGALADRAAAMLKTTAEFEMAQALRAAGGKLDRNNLIRLCHEKGLSKSTLLACLKTSVLFHVSASGVCELAVQTAPSAPATSP